MEFNMKGKVAVVMGGALGVGADLSRVFSKHGVNVVIADINEEAGQARANEINGNGGEAIFIKCDVSSEQDVKAAVDLAVSKYGRLDYGLNNVGINTDYTPLADVPSENFDKMFAINTRSVFYGMKYQIPEIIKTNGAIVNMSSAGGIVAEPNLGTYSGTKFAIVGMTKSAAVEYAKKGIRINCVCPSAIYTDGMKASIAQYGEAFSEQFLAVVPMGRFIMPEEVANVFLWLCSDYSSGVTGITLSIDGGSTAV